MLRIALFLLAGMTAGVVVATLFGNDGVRPQLPAAGDGAMERRIVALDSELSGEAARNAELRDRLIVLEQAVERLSGAPGAVDDAGAETASKRRAGSTESIREGADNEPPLPAGLRGRFANEEDWRVSQLVDAGFGEERAQWIDQRISELRMEALQEQYDAARGGDGAAAGSVLDPDRALLAELGEQEYLRYLEAMNRPTSIGIREVFANSPAEQAGLRPGDQIVSYGGQRVFAMSELNARTLEGEPGETVAIDILRDGQQIQLYVPRGPVGVTGGGRLVLGR